MLSPDALGEACTHLNTAPMLWEKRAFEYSRTALLKPIFYGLLRRPAISRQFRAATGGATGLGGTPRQDWVPFTLLNATTMPLEDRAFEYSSTALLKPIF